MKLILAIIKPFKADDVQEALADIGVDHLTLFEAKGFGRQKGTSEIYRGSEYTVTALPKCVLAVAVEDAKVESVFQVIMSASRTDKMGDGIIACLDIEEMRKIRTDERLEATPRGIDLVELRYQAALDSLERVVPAHHQRLETISSPVEAVEIHKDESLKGNPIAPVLAGICLQKALGCDENLVEAYLYYTLALVHGTPGAEALRLALRSLMSQKDHEAATAAMPQFLAKHFATAVGASPTSASATDQLPPPDAVAT